MAVVDGRGGLPTVTLKDKSGASAEVRWRPGAGPSQLLGLRPRARESLPQAAFLRSQQRLLLPLLTGGF